MKISLQQDYRKLRAAAYPPLEDLADAIVHNNSEKLEKYRQDCMAVKDKFKK